MSKSLLNTLLNYHYWAHARVWACVEALSDEDFRRELDDGSSIHGQLVHMMAAENLWINFLWHDAVEFLTPEQFPTRAAIRDEWNALEEEMRDFIESLTDEELQREVIPPFWIIHTRLKVWECLLHVFDSAVDSRARLLTSLEMVGAPTTTQDFSEHIAAGRFIHPLAMTFARGASCMHA